MGSALYVGLMSGTSMDAVDAALCEFVDGRFSSVVETRSQSYPEPLRKQLLRLQRGAGGLSLREYAALDQAVASIFADTALPLCKGQRVSAIGSHGQTVFHDGIGLRNSIQIGNPSLIAARTGVPVIADFRRADMALGGQGAPLVPAFHQAVFAQPGEARCVLNLGGIANITLLPESDYEGVRGWDTGPGNGLMDEWIEACQGKPFDADGNWAAMGSVNEDLLYALQSDDYFKQAPPKSTGRDYFHLGWMRSQFTLWEQLPAADIQRTLCELTARSVADAISRFGANTQRVLVCGGGSKNRLLMSLLTQRLPGMTIVRSDDHGLPGAWVEAAAFAWLAMRRHAYLPGNLPSVTGASRSAVLGGIFNP